MKKLLLLIFLSIGFAMSSTAQDKVIKKIIEIGQNDNQTTEHLYTLTSRFGGRLIGSDAYDNSVDWVAHEFEKWGLEVSIEEVGSLPVGFNRGAWSGRLIGGGKSMDLHFVTPSYTSGTRGRSRGKALIEPYTTAEFEMMKGAINGAWILVAGKNSGWAIDSNPKANENRKKIIAKNDSIALINREIAMNNRKNKTNEPMMELEMVPGLFYSEMVESGALGFVQSSDLPLRALYDSYVAKDKSMTFEKLPRVCDVKLDYEQYDIVYKMIKDRRDVELEFDIRNNFKLGPVTYSNVIGKIEGSKYPDEYVIVCGHLDAFDAGTGAVDCGVGVTPAMEAARMLMKAGAKPERSILFIAFAGEEFGLLGAQGWCEKHKDKLSKISNVFNRDFAPLPPVGLSVPKSLLKEFNKAGEAINSINPKFPFTIEAMEPMEKPSKMGGHDGTVFMVKGVPALNFELKDVLGYNFSYHEIWHTESDIYNKSIPEYQEHAATVIAIMALSVANMSELLPRDEVYK